MLSHQVGRIPVYNNKNNRLEGIDVIDKDYSAAKLGRIIRAKELWIITVLILYISILVKIIKTYKNYFFWQVKSIIKSGQFQEGSIGPKIKAALHFLKYHDEKAMITSIPC